MTGTNGTLDAARTGPKRPRQLLRKERLADKNLISLLTAHANGRPLNDSSNDKSRQDIRPAIAGA